MFQKPLHLTYLNFMHLIYFQNYKLCTKHSSCRSIAPGLKKFVHSNFSDQELYRPAARNTPKHSILWVGLKLYSKNWTICTFIFIHYNYMCNIIFWISKLFLPPSPYQPHSHNFDVFLLRYFINVIPVHILCSQSQIKTMHLYSLEHNEEGGGL